MLVITLRSNTLLFRSRSKHASNYTTIEHMVFRSRSKHASNYPTIEHIQPDLTCLNPAIIQGEIVQYMEYK